jgi:DNA polymerase-3 subunit alpha
LTGKKLYVKLESGQFTWLRKLFQMFPGEDRAVIYFPDTDQRKGATCMLHTALITELREKLGEQNVVLK